MSRLPGDRVVKVGDTRQQVAADGRRPALGRLILGDLQDDRPPAALRYGGTLLALALVTLVLWAGRAAVGLLDVGLVYMLVVVGATALAGPRAGILASVLSLALIDFFLVPPYYTFAISNARDIPALIVFLAVSTLVSWLIANAREHEQQARQRAEDVSRLYELNRAMMGTQQPDEVLEAIAQKVVEVFDAEACWVLLPDDVKRLAVRARYPAGAAPLGRDATAMAEWSFQHITGAEPDAMSGVVIRSIGGRHLAFVPLLAAGHTKGVLAVSGKPGAGPLTPAERTVLSTFASQAAAGLERLQLMQEAHNAEMLRRTDELKTALISAVSHDLRTPLASIVASVTSLMEPEIEWDEQTRREFLQAIYDEARRLNRLVGNLLDMSRIEGGALHPEKGWYDIAEVIEAVAQRVEPSLAGHRLVLSLQPDLPIASFDYSEIDEVITNLVENALKHTPAGTVVQVDARRDGDFLRVDVSDNGPGVPDLPRDQLDRLFDRFYQVGRRNGLKGGGLGLAIARGLVEAHGGRIWAGVPAGGGLKISFTLPLAEAPGKPVVRTAGTAQTPPGAKP